MPADNRPVCKSPPPRDFLILFNLLTIYLGPTIAAPIGQHKPFVKHKVMESKYSPKL